MGIENGLQVAINFPFLMLRSCLFIDYHPLVKHSPTHLNETKYFKSFRLNGAFQLFMRIFVPEKKKNLKRSAIEEISKEI